MTQLQKHHRTYARCWWLALLLLCGLGGCGNSDDATPTAAPMPSVDAATDIPTTDTNEIAPPLAGEFESCWILDYEWNAPLYAPPV